MKRRQGELPINTELEAQYKPHRLHGVYIIEDDGGWGALTSRKAQRLLNPSGNKSNHHMSVGYSNICYTGKDI